MNNEEIKKLEDLLQKTEDSDMKESIKRRLKTLKERSEVWKK